MPQARGGWLQHSVNRVTPRKVRLKPDSTARPRSRPSRAGGFPLCVADETCCQGPGRGISGGDASNSRDSRQRAKRLRRPPAASILIDARAPRSARGRPCSCAGVDVS